MAYTSSRSTPWWRRGEVNFTVAQGLTRIATGLDGPSFTTDGKYAFVKYSDEQAGRSPYDGGDIHAELVWVEVTNPAGVDSTLRGDIPRP